MFRTVRTMLQDSTVQYSTYMTSCSLYAWRLIFSEHATLSFPSAMSITQGPHVIHMAGRRAEDGWSGR
jgi:hypothetical protein